MAGRLRKSSSDRSSWVASWKPHPEMLTGREETPNEARRRKEKPKAAAPVSGGQGACRPRNQSPGDAFGDPRGPANFCFAEPQARK